MTSRALLFAGLALAAFGCGDDDLAHWRRGVGSGFSILQALPDDRAVAGHPVADGLRALRRFHDQRLFDDPATLLDRVIRERAVMESAVATERPRDVWRRLRFVLDQARAWVDAGGTDLRAYLRWARLQGAENARVSETVLPETDDDSVRILTIHGAKGLEFPITVVGGLTTRMQGRRGGPSVAFPPGRDAVVSVRSGVRSEGFDAWEPIDEQMDDHERRRLLYVATTRARDHLVVCLHRPESTTNTISSVLAGPGLASAAGTPFDPPPIESSRDQPDEAQPVPLPERDAWAAERAEALAAADARRVLSATTVARRREDRFDPGLAKQARDLDLPPWMRGRYGSAMGRAVHGVLQSVDLATGEGLAELAAAQATAEGVAALTDTVEQRCRMALGSSVARTAATGAHWRELWVAAPIDDRLIEGYVDLLYRDDDGLVVVDWKTDHLGDDAARVGEAVAAKVDRYRLQGASYAVAVEAATGESVHSVVFAFLSDHGVEEAQLPDLAGATDEVRARVEELAANSAGPEPVGQL